MPRAAFLVGLLIVVFVAACSQPSYVPLGVRDEPTPAPTPTREPVHLPYAVSVLHPKDGAVDVVLDATISVLVSRPAQIVELELDPPVPIAERTDAPEGLGGSRVYTFRLGRELAPSTTYTTSVTVGQREVAPGTLPTRTITWQFTTAESWPIACSPQITKQPCSAGVEVGKHYPYQLYTHCGIRWAYFDGRWWQATPPLDDGSGNPPRGWGNPYAPGTMEMVSASLARFTGRAGQTAEFKPLPVEVQDYPGKVCS